MRQTINAPWNLSWGVFGWSGKESSFKPSRWEWAPRSALLTSCGQPLHWLQYSILTDHKAGLVSHKENPGHRGAVWTQASYVPLSLLVHVAWEREGGHFLSSEILPRCLSCGITMCGHPFSLCTGSLTRGEAHRRRAGVPSSLAPHSQESWAPSNCHIHK